MAGTRNIALCFDGTWNSDDRASPTNVVKTSQALVPRTAAGTPQLRYYDRGVGTGRFDRVRGGVVGLGLARNVELAYVWLSAHYRPGDRLFLFGYSRGAYTARSLAGLLGLCGVPDPERCAAAGLGVADVAHAGMAIYRLRRGADRSERAARHVETFAVPPAASALGRGPAAPGPPCQVHFVGVWDTVGALGVPVTWLNWIGARRHRFHDVRLDRHIRHACHAVAIDEGRRPFAPTLWANRPAPGQQVEQLWFPGVHSDVGGGRPNTGLSDRALLWMWARAHAAGLGLEPDAVRAGIAPDELGPQGDSMSALYRLWGRHDRRIGERRDDGLPLVTGEKVHFSALRRLEAPETSAYREGTAARTLLPALERDSVRAAPPAPGEEDPDDFPWHAPP
ncbi:MAG: DUF2235 domain-containing protein [Acidobacteria bacterium]|nr:DUF2235 domain-containing protein [Acidobacteriota bacterium]